MNRRTFLAAAAGLGLASLDSFGQQPEPSLSGCPPNTAPAPASAKLWNPHLPEEAPPANPDEVCRIDTPNPITAMPPKGTTCPSGAPPVCIDFELPADVPVCKRRLWSTIDPEHNCQDLKLVNDLKRAYCILRQRDEDTPGNPTGLRYQAWLHAFYCSSMSPCDVHSSWAFLPWHRAFVYFHERILQDAMGDYEHRFRLPVWDWENGSQIPKFFADLGLPTFLQGPAGRSSASNGKWLDTCVLQAWLLSQKFEDFCGNPPPPAGCAGLHPGNAEGGPHSTVHLEVVSGAMRKSETSAADPIFFAHHGNVDRFWAYWMDHYSVPRKKGAACPDENFRPKQEWLDQTFCFYDERQQVVRVRASQLLDESKLGYSYDPPAAAKLCPYRSVEVRLVNALAGIVEPHVDHLAWGVFLNAVAKGSVALAAAGGNILKSLVSGDVKLQDLLNPTCFTSLPIQIHAPVKAIPGKYYLVQLVSGEDGKPQKQYPLGGFGIFGGHDHGTAAGAQIDSEVAVAGRLDAELIPTLLTEKGPYQLRYGLTNDGKSVAGETIPLSQPLVNILYPFGSEATGLYHFLAR